MKGLVPDVFLFSLDTANVTVKPQIKNVGVDTCYSCNSMEEIRSESVNMTLWNVLIQAFVTNGSKSENSKSRCCHTSHSGCNVSLTFPLMITVFSLHSNLLCC